MAAKKKSKSKSKIDWHLQKEGHLPVNPNIKFWDSFQLGKRTLLNSGDKIKIKGERGIFIFERFCKNESNGKEWIDCMDKNKCRRSFTPDRCQKPTKSKAKK